MFEISLRTISFWTILVCFLFFIFDLTRDEIKGDLSGLGYTMMILVFIITLLSGVFSFCDDNWSDK